MDSQGCPLDTDGDGVYDYQDQCPGTPRGVTVDSQGCPLDSDDDGVYDNLDQCPGTPRGIKVNSKGCPLDSDGDGVLDTDDQCPNTPKGAKVNEQGCWVLLNVQFDTNKYDIKGLYFSAIDEVASILERNPSLNIKIQGHTDNKGSESFNKTLSENRAKAIVEYLVKKGVEADRLSASGFGPSNPVATNETREGRAKNRRVELHPLN